MTPRPHLQSGVDESPLSPCNGRAERVHHAPVRTLLQHPDLHAEQHSTYLRFYHRLDDHRPSGTPRVHKEWRLARTRRGHAVLPALAVMVYGSEKNVSAISAIRSVKLVLTVCIHYLLQSLEQTFRGCS